MKRFILSLGLIISLFSLTYAQINISIPDTTYTQGIDTIRVPLNVTNFNNVEAISLVINYDTSAVHFANIEKYFTSGNFSFNGSGGRITISWFDLNPFSITDGKILNLVFTNPTGNTALHFETGTCEIADANLNILSINYKDGSLSETSTLAKPGNISGLVWNDENKDGLINNNEQGIQWVTVNLYKCDGTWLAYKLTDVHGDFAFYSVPVGSYYLTFELTNANKAYQFTEEGIGSDSTINSHAVILTDTTAQTSCIDLTSGETYGCANAGVYLKNIDTSHTASVSGFVWKDLSVNDGIQGPGDFGIPNVPVKLLDCSSSSVLDSTETDQTGHYKFENLAAGEYEVQFILLPSYVFVVQHNGSDTTKDSDPNQQTGITQCFNLADGEQLSTIDAGMSYVLFEGSPAPVVSLDDGIVTAPDSGGTTIYKIKYQNTGSGNLYNASIIDTLPAGLVYVSSTIGGETSQGNNIFRYDIGNLASNSSGEIDLTAMVDDSEAAYYNVVYLSGNDSKSVDTVVSASDLDIADTTSNSDDGGVESRGDMAEFLLLRHLKIQYGLTSKVIANSKLNKTLASVNSLNTFIPATGPYNSKAVEATPFDILGISNAISAYAVNYNVSLSGKAVRIGGVFSTITAAPYIYDHLKAVCDRMNGYDIDEIKLVGVNGYKFYAAKLVKPDLNTTDYAISFSVYETSSGYKVQNKWTYEEYTAPNGASSVYNFQVWANSYSAAEQLVKSIISNFSNKASVSYMNINQNNPDVFIRKAYYTHDGLIHLNIVNNSTTAVQVNLNTAFRISQGDNQLQTNNNQTINPGVNDVVLNTGIISDANVYLSQTNGFNDEIYVSGGAYTYLTGPNSTVTTFNTGNYAQPQTTNYPKGSLLLSGGANTAGQLGDWATVVRALNGNDGPYDLSNYNNVIFNAKGTGTIEVILNLSNTVNNNYYMHKINLTSQDKQYTINFNQFKLLNGNNTTIDLSKVEDIGFVINTTDNPGLNNFNFEVKDIAFTGENITAVDNQDNSVPKKFNLSQNYPNPFNPSTVITFSVPRAQAVTLTVYNIIGQKITTLINSQVSAGRHNVVFDASKLSRGIYFYQLEGEGVDITKKMILAK